MLNKGWFDINLGTGDGYSILDIIKEFENSKNVTIPYRVSSRRKGDVPESYADVKKQRIYWDRKQNGCQN